MRKDQRRWRLRGTAYFQLLLRCLPKRFRARHGGELEQVFEEMREALGERPGRLTLARFYGGLTCDVARRAWPEWRRARRGSGTLAEMLRGGGRLLRDLPADLRFAVRTLRKRPLFAAIAVLSLAVGMGVNTALFTVFHATWLRGVSGVDETDRIVEVLSTYRGDERQEWSYPDFQDVREAETPLQDLAGWKYRDGSLATDDGNQIVRVAYVSANYFRVLGVIPSSGRSFLDREDAGPGQHPVAVVSHGMWQSRLGGSSDVIGRTITLIRTPYTVVGVAPDGFRGHRNIGRNIDLYLPLMQHPLLAGKNSLERERDSLWLLVLGRLESGASVNKANAALATVFARLALEHPESHGDRGARALAFGPIPAYGRAGSTLAAGAVFALGGLVLLVICGNVAGMVLARSVTREREIAVRLALGSGRGRLVWHFLVEALVLAVIGGGLGVLLTFWGTGVASPFTADLGLANVRIRPDGVVLLFSLALTLAATIVVGLVPAIRATRPGLTSSLKGDVGGGVRRVGRIHRLAASAQAGIALLLLVVASLFVRALGVMEERDLWFDPHNLLVTRMDLSLEGYESPEQAILFLDRVRATVGSLPGVASVSIADGIPLDLVGNFTAVSPADTRDEEGGRVGVEFTRASEGYFRTIGTPLMRGRGFDNTDDASSEGVVVITRALAEKLFPGEDPLGRRVRFALALDDAREGTVIGLVGDVASSRATENHPHVFVALRQSYWPRVMVVVKGTVGASALAKPIQSAVLAVDPSLSVPEVVTSESLVARSTRGQREMAAMAGGLGSLTLILSAIGVYGVVAFAVASRTREIGLRMALGATRWQVLGSIMGDALRLAAPGLLVGGLLAAGTATVMRSELLGVSSLDPTSFLSGVGVLLLVVMLASVVPASRASAVHPMAALRWE